MIYVVGLEQNPKRSRGSPLDPLLPGAGQNLFKMSGLSIEEYQAKVVRINIEDDPYIPEGSWTFLLGREVGEKFTIKGDWFTTVHLLSPRLKVTLLPHPSGKCLLYNDQQNRDKVRQLFKEALG